MSEYWPDLSKLPHGWRLGGISWAAGRATVKLLRTRDDALMRSTGSQSSPAAAFDDAVAKVVASEQAE